MFSTELWIAWRYIKSKRKEKVISAIAAFSLVGIALGVATLIIVTSVMNGFRKEFTERVIGFNGHVVLYQIRNNTDYKKSVEKILKIQGVKQAVPAVERHALMSNKKMVKGSLVYGILLNDLKRKKIVCDNIISGDLDCFNQEDTIVLGDSIAKRSGLIVGDDVILIAPEMDETGFGFMPRKKTFRLVATFKSGMHEYDNTVSYIQLSMAQKLFNMRDNITNISVFVENPLDIANIKNQITRTFYQEFDIMDWQNSNSSFMKAVEIERNVMFLILTLITFVASFNIISCMIMLVKDKEKDIAILRTIGIMRASITRIFFIVGASIGIFGTLIGAISGVLFSLNIKKIQAAVEAISGAQVFSPEVYFLTHLPSLLRPIDVIITISVSLLLSCLATLYPARKASRLNPTDILRYA